jgi:hypothetical protein
MAIDRDQLRDVIIKPALIAIGLYSEDAVSLLLGTCAQESQLGRYLVQQGIGFKGGIGIYQIQALSYNSAWNKQVECSTAMKAKIRLYLGYQGQPAPERMASDLSLATIMCRLYYYGIHQPLPKADDIQGQAEYWKKYYNTSMGKGTVEQFVKHYQEFIR